MSQNHSHRHSNSGFSIITLVIAVLLLGMVTGGVIFANMLINSASAQKLVAKISKYDAANETFKITYRAIPGDAKRLMPAGDDNGYLNDQLGVCDLSTGKYLNDEKYQVWAHLSVNGMIDGEAYESFSPKKCGGTHDENWAAAGNGSLWPSIALNEQAIVVNIAVNGAENGDVAPILIGSNKRERDFFMQFKVNAEDAIKFERKFAETANAANIIELKNLNGSGNCHGAEDILSCAAENAGYAEYTYHFKK